MPIWTYRCKDNHETELIVLSISQEPIPTAPCHHCGLQAERAEFERTGPPHLPGEGFYKSSVSGPMHNKPDPTKSLTVLDQKGLL